MADKTKLPHVEGKRKRKFHPEIPSATPSEVTSQAPRGINVAEYAEARALEIHNMVRALTTADSGSSKRVFQSVPRHMRRRAVSHNVKRLPVRLRESGKKEMEKSGCPDKEKKSRRKRRRPKNLLSDYSRRQKKHTWLETHLWHAKRMKMIDMWGYRLALHPNDKSVRAAHRAVKRSCLLQDVSYMGCIEVSGSQKNIVKAMGHITSQDAGLTIAAKSFLGGCREGHVTLYKPNHYPCGAIGPVRVLWCQRAHIPDSDQDSPVAEAKRQKLDSTCLEIRRSAESGEEARLWIWVHPACFQEAFDSIVEVCKLVGSTAVFTDETQNESSVSDDVETKGDVIGAERIKEGGATDANLTVTSRRFELLRFRLQGPESHALLAATLRLADVPEQHKCGMELDQTNVDASYEGKAGNDNPDSTKRTSVKAEVNCGVRLGNSRQQVELWAALQRVSSPSVCPQGCVVGLTVLDPRLDLPGKKTSVHAATEDILCADQSSQQLEDQSDTSLPRSALACVLSQWPSDCAASPIWEEQVRSEVKATKIPEQELNRRRSRLLVPGSKLDLGEDTARIPILLIQQPGCPAKDSKHGVPTGYASGWDIIIPSGWAMAFWMALVYRGARTGGLREAHTSAQEQGVLSFPDDWPDTSAGVCHAKKVKEEGEAKYSRYPPAKRPNYNKLGVPSPFSAAWDELAEDWDSRDVMSSIAGTAVETGNEVPAVERGCFYVLRSKSKLDVLRHLVAAGREKRTRGKKSGKEHELSASESSIAQLQTIMRQNGRSLVCVSLRMLDRGTPLPHAMLAIPSREDLDEYAKCKSFAGPVEPLHKGLKAQRGALFSDQRTLIGSCSRETIGFVTSGQFSLAIGCGSAVGYCALPGLVKLLSMGNRNKGVLVLVRNTTTQQYRLAQLDVV